MRGPGRPGRSGAKTVIVDRIRPPRVALAQVGDALVGDGRGGAHRAPVAHVQPVPVQPSDAARRVPPRHPGAERRPRLRCARTCRFASISARTRRSLRRSGYPGLVSAWNCSRNALGVVEVDSVSPRGEHGGSVHRCAETSIVGRQAHPIGADLPTRLLVRRVARWPAVNEIVDVTALGAGPRLELGHRAPRWARRPAARLEQACSRSRLARHGASGRRSRPSRWPGAGCRRAAAGTAASATNPGWTSLRLWWRRFGHGSGKKIRIPASESCGTRSRSSVDGVAAEQTQVGQRRVLDAHEQRGDAGLEDLDGEVVDVRLGGRQRRRRLPHARADLQDERGAAGRTRRAGRRPPRRTRRRGHVDRGHHAGPRRACALGQPVRWWTSLTRSAVVDDSS